MTTRGTDIKVRTTKPSPKTKMKKRATTASTAARKKVLTASRRRTNVNVITRQMGLMSIPKTLETRGTIMRSNGNNTLRIQLSRSLITDLKDIYALSEKYRVEIAGLIECTFDSSYANFIGPTIRTNHQMTSVRLPEPTAITKMTYHTHPSPAAPPGSTYTSIPSGPDFNAYIQTHRNGVIEANIIVEQQGMYVIDVIRPTNRAVGEDVFNTIIEKIRGAGGFNHVIEDTILVFNFDIGRWKRFINNTLDPFLTRQYGLSIQFYKWNELPQVRISSLPRRGASP